MSKEKVICIRVSEEMFARLEAYCKHYRIKKSRVIVGLLNQFLKIK